MCEILERVSEWVHIFRPCSCARGRWTLHRSRFYKTIIAYIYIAAATVAAGLCLCWDGRLFSAMRADRFHVCNYNALYVCNRICFIMCAWLLYCACEREMLVRKVQVRTLVYCHQKRFLLVIVCDRRDWIDVILWKCTNFLVESEGNNNGRPSKQNVASDGNKVLPVGCKIFFS